MLVKVRHICSTQVADRLLPKSFQLRFRAGISVPLIIPKALATFTPLLRREGFLPTTKFEQGDANTIAFPKHSFDVLVFHDIFYETTLNVPEVLARFNGFLKPGGHVYLDFMNLKTVWLWRLLGKERKYKRYSIGQIRAALHDQGFEILEMRRSVGTNSKLIKALSTALWIMLGTSNAYGLIARKKNDREA